MYIICYLPLFPTQASAINTVIVINIINVDSITTILQTLCLYILSSTSPAGYPGNKKKKQSYITWLIDVTNHNRYVHLSKGIPGPFLIHALSRGLLQE